MDIMFLLKVAQEPRLHNRWKKTSKNRLHGFEVSKKYYL